MKLINLLAAALLSVSVANADEVMKSSMTKMEIGVNMIQKGFMHNDTSLILDGAKLVQEGNTMFSDQNTIAQYLPKGKEHLSNVGVNQAFRIDLDAKSIAIRVDSKDYVNATTAYTDMLNACSHCHALVRNW